MKCEIKKRTGTGEFPLLVLFRVLYSVFAGYLKIFFSVVFQVSELGVLRQPCQLYGSDRTVSLLGNDDLGNTLVR